MSARHERQSFLGEHSESIIQAMRLGIVGANGGGAHIVQQCGHVGFYHYAVYDPDRVDWTNMNRNVLATIWDAIRRSLKIKLAHRRLRAVVGKELDFQGMPCRWQDDPGPLSHCDAIIGCVDSFKERSELEAFARRRLIPYIDLGLDVHTIDGQRPRMAGQVFMSMPGGPCMWCARILSEDRLAKEAARYGDAGPSPQVVWANGVLASTAIGLLVNLFCDWTAQSAPTFWLCYDGNTNLVSVPDRRLEFVPARCAHYPVAEVGDPRFITM